MVEFPLIHTNFWDAVYAIPIIMLITQILKIYLRIPKKYVPTLPLILGLFISVFISHRHNRVAGLFMGWFYGYAAIGNYAALKTSIIAYQQYKKRQRMTE